MICNVKKLGICSVLHLMVLWRVDVSAKCEEYAIIFKEEKLKYGMYRFTPVKPTPDILDEIIYSDNSTIAVEKKPCILELHCESKNTDCFTKPKVEHHETHSVIADYISETKKKLENITTKGNRTEPAVDKVKAAPTYDINLIFIHTNHTESTFTECDLAKTVCSDEGTPENYSDIRNTSSKKLPETLEIAIYRDETSPVQPMFTGYLPGTPEESTKHKDDRTDFKTVNLVCDLFESDTCKESIEKTSIKGINVYIKTNYIQNNTVTKYPNCKNHSITLDNTLNVKCDSLQFSKHNKHILLPPEVKDTTTIIPDNQTNQNLVWNCHINTLPEEILDNIGEIYFDDCLLNNKSNIYKVMAPKNEITIRLSENKNICDQNSSYNVHKGKIIALEKNNKGDKYLEHNILVLNVSNCINVNTNSMKPHPETELTIFLKSESLTASNLKQYIPKELTSKPNIILRCDPLEHDYSSVINDKTVLRCESIVGDVIEMLTETIDGTTTETLTEITKTHDDITETPTGKTNTHDDIIETPTGKTNTHDDTTETPTGKTNTHDDIGETPTGKTNTHDDITKTPTGKTNTHDDTTETPTGKTNTHDDITKTPTGKTNTHDDITKTPTGKTNTHDDIGETPTGKTNTHDDITKTPTGKTNTHDDTTETPTGKTNTHDDIGETPTGKTNTHDDITETPTGKTNTHDDITKTPTGKTKKKNDTTNIKMIENKENKNNITENSSGSKNKARNSINGAEQSNLAQETELEKIILILFVSVAGVSLMLVLAMKRFSKPKRYNVAPTTEPPNDEETPF